MKRAPALLLAALALAAPSPAGASKPKLRLERVDPTALKEEQLRVFASAVELEGNVVEDLRAPQFTLLVDGRAAGRATKVQLFEAANEDVVIAFVVETSAQYKKNLDDIKAALKEFLEESPRRMRAMVIPYGSDAFEPGRAFEPAAAIADQVDDLSPDEDSVDLRMADAVNAAILQLKKLDPKEPGTLAPRRLIVLVSDGMNTKMDRPTFRTLGDKAAKAGFPIHSIAFSPTDERGPLLNLGELSKRSNGTFRWAEKPADLKQQFTTLADEIKKQYVLTFPSKVKEPTRHTFRLRCDEMLSNALGKDQFANLVKGDAKQGFFGRLGGWLWAILGALFVLLVGVLLLVLRARDGAAPAKPKAPKAPKPPKPTAQKSGTPAPKATATAARAAGPTTLIGIGGALGGNRIAVRGTLTMGKAPGLTLTIADDPTVSTRHCEVATDGNGPYVRDLGSTNGTFVNNQRVSGVHRLSDGDILRLGANTQFKIRID